MKIETLTFEYKNCGECSNAGVHPTERNPLRCKCLKANRILKDLWEGIPDWCPLENKPDGLD